MKFSATTAAAAVAAAMILSAGVATAQNNQGQLFGNRALDDRIDDLNDDVTDDFANSDDAARFGSVDFAPGWTGSVSASASATDGNTETANLSFGGRFRYGQGVFNHTFGFLGEVGYDDDELNKEDYFAVYDVNRSFTEQFYLFGIARVQYGAVGDDPVTGIFNSDDHTTDAFLGFGPGYRIFNTEQLAWRVQAGPGYRYIEDAAGNTSDDLAAIASSRFFYRFTDTVFMTNDTDVLYSDTNTSVTNDFGINLTVTNSLSTRFSYFIDYDSDPAPGFEKTDSTIRASLVYSFN